jgi:hypothetical protein
MTEILMGLKKLHRSQKKVHSGNTNGFICNQMAPSQPKACTSKVGTTIMEIGCQRREVSTLHTEIQKNAKQRRELDSVKWVHASTAINYECDGSHSLQSTVQGISSYMKNLKVQDQKIN